MVNEGVRRAYTSPDNPLRASMLADPAGSRKTTRETLRPWCTWTSSPAIGSKSGSRTKAAARRTTSLRGGAARVASLQQTTGRIGRLHDSSGSGSYG